MIDQFCPNPAIAQRLYAGPLGAHIDTFAQRLLAQGYASSTPKYAMRLLAELSTWLQEQGLVGADLDEQRVGDFLEARYRHHRPHRTDRATLRKLLEQLQEISVIANTEGGVGQPGAQ